jgi:hypothetical protein
LATVRILRSTTAGNVPPSLVSGQIAINEGDGKLFYRNGSGVVTALPTGASLVRHATTAGFPATGQEGVLYLSVDTSKIYRWESTVYVEVAAIATTVSASDITSGILPDARLSGDVTRNENLRWAMQTTAASIDWLPRNHGTIGNASATSGNLKLAFFTAPYNLTATTITFVNAGTSTASLSLCRFALFTVSETITDSVTATTPSITMVARTASDTTIGNVANTIYSRAFSTTGGYPASYNLVAGTRYAVGLLIVGSTPGTWQAATVTSGSFMRLPPMAAGAVTGLTDIPTAATSVPFGNFILYGRIS